MMLHDSSQRLARAGAEVEDHGRGDLARGRTDDVLQLFVTGNLGPHHVEIGGGIEVELLGHHTLATNAAKASSRHSRKTAGSAIAAGSSAIPTSRRSLFPNTVRFTGHPSRGPNG